jgi:hypothetical protein
MKHASELKTLRGFLHNAGELTKDAGEIAQTLGDIDQAARIKNITHRISDEIDVTERRLAEAERLEGGSGK